MTRQITTLFIAMLAAAVLASDAWSQNPYGGTGSNARSQRRLPTFGAGSDSLPQTGTYQSNDSQLGRSQLSQTYPPAPRVRRPIISPYLNLNRPEGIVGGVPNYYSLVRPEVNAFNRYKQGVESFRQFEQDTAKRQQELYQLEQRNREEIEQQIQAQAEALRPAQTQYRSPSIRATGHQTSFGVR